MSQQQVNGTSKLYNASLSNNASSPLRTKPTAAATQDNQQSGLGSCEEDPNAAIMRNSSLSNYILIKNSQSSLMGNTGGAQLIHKQIAGNNPHHQHHGGSLLLPTNLVQSHGKNSHALDTIDARMNDLKLSCISAANKNICHEQTAQFANDIK
jgi:hypothetical protein